MRRARVLSVVACCGLLPLAAGCVVHIDSGGYTSREQVHFTVPDTPTVDLSTFDGAIEVQAWDKAEVLVRVESRAASKSLLESIDVQGSHQDGRVVVTVTATPLANWDVSTAGMTRSARLIASVPVKPPCFTSSFASAPSTFAALTLTNW